MLQSLYIQNYALIDELEIKFGSGMNAIVGETGAGKSILMGALGLTLGDRADSLVVTAGATKCVVEAKFEVGDSLKKFFDKNELDFDSTCILRRELTALGKSRAFVNDSPVSLLTMRELAAQLADLHTQHETLELKGKDLQLQTVDGAAGNAVLFDEYIAAFKKWNEAKASLKALETEEAEANRQRDYLEFLHKELNEAALMEGELEQLESELQTLSNAESILENCQNALVLLSQSDANLLDQLAAARTSLLQAAKNLQSLTPLTQRLESSYIELKDIATEIEAVTEQVQLSPDRLEAVNDRLKLLHQLQTKHRVKTIAELLQLQTDLQEKLQAIFSLNENIAATQNRVEQHFSRLTELGEKLTGKRQKALATIEKELNKMLTEVGLENAKLRIDLETKAEPMSTGFDMVSFLFAANKGSDFIPLEKAASGGELSRLMLCIKTFMAGKNSLDTLIFDEIDSGISGETALKVGNMMRRLSQHHQVICITHLPQIAAKAEHVYAVYKQEANGKTYTRVNALKGKTKLEAIAQMLGGIKYTETALQTAAELTAN